MRRRRLRRASVQSAPHAERWLVSYADFITLLLAFFVVMYSISQVSESKYRVLASTIQQSFAREDVSRDALSREVMPVMMQGTGFAPVELPPIDLSDTDSEPGGDDSAIDAASQKAVAPADIATRLQSVLAEQIDKEWIMVNGNDRTVELILNADMLFDSGSAVPGESARRLLFDVATSLRDVGGDVRVEGHTDNVPVRSATYPSNWELSAARAAAVVAALADHGVAPERLSVVGYGEFRPVGSNVSEKSRQKNRRVVLVIDRQE